jgi:O-antigen/teichoic acid export membrane protein
MEATIGEPALPPIAAPVLRAPAGGAFAAARQGAVAVVAQGIYSGTTFLSTVILGRLCDRESFGVYYLAFTVVLFVQGIQERLISTPYTIYCNRRSRDSQAGYTASVFLHQVFLSLLAAAASLAAFAGFALTGVMRELAPVMLVLAGMLPLLMLRGFVRQLLIAHLDLATATLLDAAVAALQLGGLLALGAAGRLTVPTAYLVMGGSSGIAVTAWYLVKRPALALDPSRVVADWLKNWTFAKWVVASNLAGSVAIYAVPWILTGVRDTAATALLGACLSLVGLANMFMAGLESYLTPKTARSYAQGGMPGLMTVLWKSTLLIAFLLGAMCVFFALAGEPLAAMIYKNKYAGAGPIVTLLAIGVLINSLGNSAGRGLWVLDHPRGNLLPDAALSVVTLAVFFVLVQPFGAFGAAIATLAGNLAGALLRTWSFAKVLGTIQQSEKLRGTS